MVENGWYVCPHCGDKKVCRVETDFQILTPEKAKSLESSGIVGAYEPATVTKVFVWCKKCKKEVELKL